MTGVPTFPLAVAAACCQTQGLDKYSQSNKGEGEGESSRQCVAILDKALLCLAVYCWPLLTKWGTSIRRNKQQHAPSYRQQVAGEWGQGRR